jgi:predicted dehydrogenase
MIENKEKLSRRDFLGTTALGVAGLALGSSTRPVRGAVSRANETVNVGLIGAGAQGHGLIRGLAVVPNAKITALCEIFEPHLNRGIQLSRSQPKTFTDYRKLLESKDVDAVVISTPLHLHHEMVLAALAAGKHVYVEKTMAYSVKQCDEMVRAAKGRPSLVLQVGHQRRHNLVVKRVVEMARDGAVGTLTHIRCAWHRNGNWRRPVPQSNFDPRPWGYPDLEHLINWRMYKRYSGGLMAELGSHMIEIANLIYGAMPVAVTGFGGIDYWKDGRETYDNVMVVYTYPGGQKTTFSSLTTNAHDGELIQVMGTEGTIEFSWDQARYFQEKESTELIKADEVTVFSETGETMKAGKQEQAAPVEPEARRRVDAGYLALESFITCIREGKKPEVDVEVGRNAAVSVLLANRAMEEGRVVKF